jgi:cob(I)alamin adenosyltransferase
MSGFGHNGPGLHLVDVSHFDLALYAGGRYPYNAGMLEKGLVQIYTGHGKGKTTAAFGLALRAAGRGNKVLIYQFLKPPALEIGERLALQRETLGIRLEALDVVWDMSASAADEKAVAEMRIAISEVLARIAEMAQNRLYDVLILDEIVFCLSKGLAKLQDVENLINRRYPTVEIVLTGRGATSELIELADLVTEMKSIKHPFDAGQPARPGIEY